MYCKIHHQEGKTVFAACDKNLIGKKVKHRYSDYTFTISKAFYQGKEVTAEELKELLPQFDNINLFGEKTVAVAIELGLINQNNIIRIDDIPHAVVIQV